MPACLPLSSPPSLSPLLHPQVICHGIPDMRELQDGDIVNIDISTFYRGYHGDLNEVRRHAALLPSLPPVPPLFHPPFIACFMGF